MDDGDQRRRRKTRKSTKRKRKDVAQGLRKWQKEEDVRGEEERTSPFSSEEDL